MTFQLDTSGRVECAASFQPIGWAIWSDLSPFTQGYTEALFAGGMWGLSCKPCAGNGEVVTDWDRYLGAPEPGDQGGEGTTDCPTCGGHGSLSVGFSDLAPETLARIIADCERWQRLYPKGRSGHEGGAYCWELRQAQHVERPDFPPLTVQLGDDGKVRFAEPAQTGRCGLAGSDA